MRDALHWISTGNAVYWVDIKMSALMMPDTAVTTRTNPGPCRQRKFGLHRLILKTLRSPRRMKGCHSPWCLSDPRSYVRPLDLVSTSAGYFPHLRVLSLLNSSVRTQPSKSHQCFKNRSSARCVVVPLHTSHSLCASGLCQHHLRSGMARGASGLP